MNGIELVKEQQVEQINELKGDCACPGHARGVVKIVERLEQMSKMHEGNILVAHSTNPDIVPVMKKAAAIITDLGGITCHAAVVSRELRIPCVIGMRIATKALKTVIWLKWTRRTVLCASFSLSTSPSSPLR